MNGKALRVAGGSDYESVAANEGKHLRGCLKETKKRGKFDYTVEMGRTVAACIQPRSHCCIYLDSFQVCSLTSANQKTSPKNRECRFFVKDDAVSSFKTAHILY